jgi:translation initiation factor 3 subunit A
MAVKQIEKDKKSKEERLEGINKRMDHLERAFREEERPLLVLDYERQQAEDRRQHDAVHDATNKAGREAHERDLAAKERLQRLVSHYSAYRERVGGETERRNKDLQRQSADKIAQAKAERRKEVLAQRETDRIKAEAQAEEDARTAARLRAEREGALAFLMINMNADAVE